MKQGDGSRWVAQGAGAYLQSPERGPANSTNLEAVDLLQTTWRPTTRRCCCNRRVAGSAAGLARCLNGGPIALRTAVHPRVEWRPIRCLQSQRISDQTALIAQGLLAQSCYRRLGGRIGAARHDPSTGWALLGRLTAVRGSVDCAGDLTVRSL